MSSTIVLFSMFFISIAGITALLSYKIMRMAGGGESNISNGISADVFKDKVIRLFERTHKKGTHFVLKTSKRAYSKAGKRISERYTVFSDTMNGKGDVSKKGAASFFLKSVSEHKKKIREERD